MKRFLMIWALTIFSMSVFAADKDDFYAPTLIPDRIMMTISSSNGIDRAVTWRTSFEETRSEAQIMEQSANPGTVADAITVEGANAPWERESKNAMGHKVYFSNLTPNTKYQYRVGNGKHWSEWFHFTTPSDKPEKFSFLYFGDIQNEIKSFGSRLFRAAYTACPDARFMLFGGDLVSVPNESYWREFFYAGGWIFGMIPSAPSAGNHESNPISENFKKEFSRQWSQIFAMPENGPDKKYQDRVYYFDYQGVRFISLYSSALLGSDKDKPVMLDWLEQTLRSNPNPWCVVYMHHPVYSCGKSRDHPDFRDAVKPLFETYGVDLVLTGHDHTYCRGQHLEEVAKGTKNPPMYVVSMAGQKMYDLNPKVWSDKQGQSTQLFQYITVDGNVLKFEAWDVTGRLFDTFTLTKEKYGANKVTE